MSNGVNVRRGGGGDGGMRGGVELEERRLFSQGKGEMVVGLFRPEEGQVAPKGANTGEVISHPKLSLERRRY